MFDPFTLPFATAIACVASLKLPCKVKLPTFSNGLVEFKNGFEFQLQRKLFSKRSVVVEMRFICLVLLVYSKVATLSNNSTVEFIKV